MPKSEEVRERYNRARMIQVSENLVFRAHFLKCAVNPIDDSISMSIEILNIRAAVDLDEILLGAYL